MTRIQPIHILVRIVVLGAAVWAAVRLAPGFRFPSAEEIPAGGWLQLAAVAVIFGMLNAYLKPVLKALSWPVELVTGNDHVKWPHRDHEFWPHPRPRGDPMTGC